MDDFLMAVMIAATPLLFATIGELLSEKAGNLNLGVEGMMLMGAVIGFRIGLITENPYLSILGALTAGAAGALIYAFLTVSLKTNQVVTGLTLTIFGTGFAGFVGRAVIGIPLPTSLRSFFLPIKIPVLSEIPAVGKMLFAQDIYVYLSYLCVIVVAIYLYKTRLGLNTRAVGENAAAADASGIPVNLYKYMNIIIGGALCGLGGGYMSLAMIPVWQENVTAGRGWIAVALVIFASWNPIKAVFGALLFGGLSILGYRLQSMGISVSQYLVDMIPYIATVLVVIISTRKNRKEDTGPADLSNAYFREER